MKAHKTLSNTRRTALGLPPLENGPVYSLRAEHEQYLLFLSLPINEGVQAMAVGSPSAMPHSHHVEVAQPPVQVYHAASTLDSESRTDASLLETSQELDVANADTEVQSTADPETNYELVDNRDMASDLAQDSDSFHSYSPQSEAQPFEKDGSPSEESTIESPIATGGLQAGAELRFKEWMHENRAWVELFIKNGTSLALMDDALGLLDAPVKATQLRRNLAKYTQFNPIPYIACRGHMLIARQSDQQDTDAALTCDVCLEEGTEPDLVTFEYLPIEPRLRAWVKNEESCRNLFEYYQGMITKRAASLSSAQGELPFYEDFFDSEIYLCIATNIGGPNAVRFDLFIAASCDGFQTFEKRNYDCWPLLALNHNLPPDQRYLFKNIIPLGFIKGPKEPVRLHTWLNPLKEELDNVNKDGGTRFRFFDGVWRRTRVHVLYVTADSAARKKITGLVGHNGKAPCPYCNVRSVWSPEHRHAYIPTKCRVLVENGGDAGNLRISRGTGGTVMRSIYDPSNPPYRCVADVEETLRLLDEDSSLSQTEKNATRKRTGIKQRTVAISIHSITPYMSFPLDTMHMFMNIVKDMMDIFRGRCFHLTSLDDRDGFVVSSASWRSIDCEMGKLKKGTSPSAFHDVPRTSNYSSQWKAAECHEFLLHYALVIFDGHLPVRYMKNLHMLCCILEYCRRPALRSVDVASLKELCIDFVTSFEALYYRKDVRRVGVCKSTIHGIVHLGWSVEKCGPPILYSQWWVERYVGEIKRRLHARDLAAESLNENAKFLEEHKLYFGNHFFRKTQKGNVDSTDGNELQESIELLSPCDRESLRNPFHIRKRTRALLAAQVRKAEGISEQEANEAVLNDEIWSFGRMNVPCGEDRVVMGAKEARRHRRFMKRSDFYVATEFYSGHGDSRDVYYGRLLRIFKYTFRISDREKTRKLVLLDWPGALEVNQFDQVYQADTIGNVFRNPTVEDATVVLNAIGVVEHRSPNNRESRTFFIDPCQKSNDLLKSRAGVDGVNRDLVRRRRRA